MKNANEKSKECCEMCSRCFPPNCDTCPCHKPSVNLHSNEVEVSKWYKVTYITDSPELIDSTTIESIPLDRDEREEKYCKYHCKCMNLSKSCPHPHYLDLQCICPRPTPNLTPESTEMEEWGNFNIDSLRHYRDEEGNLVHCNCDDEVFWNNIKNVFSSHSQKLVSEFKKKIEKELKECEAGGARLDKMTIIYLLSIINNIKI